MQARLVVFVTLAALFSGSFTAPVINDAQVGSHGREGHLGPQEIHRHEEHRFDGHHDQHHKRELGPHGREGRPGPSEIHRPEEQRFDGHHDQHHKRELGPHGREGHPGPQEQRLDGHHDQHHKRELGSHGKEDSHKPEEARRPEPQVEHGVKPHGRQDPHSPRGPVALAGTRIGIPVQGREEQPGTNNGHDAAKSGAERPRA